MAKETETNRSRGGLYCIAPGCSNNELYRIKTAGVMIHFHTFDKKTSPQVLASCLKTSDRLSRDMYFRQWVHEASDNVCIKSFIYTSYNASQEYK